MARTFLGSSSLLGARNTAVFYLAPYDSFSSISELLGLPDLHDNLLSPFARTLLQVLFTYHCRITELLQLTTSSLLRGSKMAVKGNKGSASYTIFLPNINHYFEPASKSGSPVRIFPFSYTKVYRWCIKANIYASLSSHSNRAVTHLSRYVLADDILNLNAPVAVSDLLKHRNPANSKFYLNKGVNYRG